jgi:2-polyprenyl-6-methoxyphenol hydroxylase-like FAD-dependent oxidoreductase
MHKTIPVLIVGAGPTGLMMACQLALRGVAFRIVDKSVDHTTQSRALVMHARSLEILDQMGIADKAIAVGRPGRGVGSYFGGKKMMRLNFSQVGVGLSKFPYVLLIEQSRTEELLVNFLRSMGHEVERQVELVDFKPEAGDVIATLKLGDGTKETLSAQYLIGADGAHSIVRHGMGLAFQGLTYEQPLFVLDCKVDADLPADQVYLSIYDKGLTGFFPIVGGRWRIIGTLPPGTETKKELTFHDIEKGFEDRVKIRAHIYDPEWISVYNSHHRCAATFRKDRCFLVGDAAHIHSPVGGQGMNTGLQDAYNLAWKLALVIQGKAPEKLLDSYTDERIVVARTLVKTTDRFFHFFTDQGPIKKYLRLHILPLLLQRLFNFIEQNPGARRFAFRTLSQIGIKYRHGELTTDASFGHFAKDSPAPGDRWPYLAADNKNIQDDLTGTGFHHFIFHGQNNADFSAVKKVAAQYGGLITSHTIPFSPRLKDIHSLSAENGSHYLVRPDMYVAYRSTSANASHFQAYLKRVIR